MLAHQGGWDEMLLVIGPMIVIVLLLRLAKRRVEQVEQAKRTGDADGDPRTDRGTDRDGGATPPV